jgi:hypothetical protein
MSPLALDISIRARIIGLKRDAQALAAAAAEIEARTGVWPRLEGDDKLLANGALDAGVAAPPAQEPGGGGPPVRDLGGAAPPVQDPIRNPRPIMILPPSYRMRRLLLAGLIVRRAT